MNASGHRSVTASWRQALAGVATLVAINCASSAALAADATVLVAGGEVVVVRAAPAGPAVPVHSGTELSTGDLLRTGADGRVQFRFSDGALVSLQPRSEFRIDDYRFSADSQRGFFSLLRGTLRTSSGAIGKRNQDDYRLRTPTAVVGIRGTNYVAEETVCDPLCYPSTKAGLRVSVAEGRIVVTSRAGSIEVGSGESAAVESPDAMPYLTQFGPLVLAPVWRGTSSMLVGRSASSTDPEGSTPINKSVVDQATAATGATGSDSSGTTTGSGAVTDASSATGSGGTTGSGTTASSGATSSSGTTASSGTTSGPGSSAAGVTTADSTQGGTAPGSDPGGSIDTWFTSGAGIVASAPGANGTGDNTASSSSGSPGSETFASGTTATASSDSTPSPADQRGSDGGLMILASLGGTGSGGGTGDTGSGGGTGDTGSGGGGTGDTGSGGEVTVGSTPVERWSLSFATAGSGIDQPSLPAGSTVVLDDQYRLKSVGICPDINCLQSGSAQFAETGSETYVVWGRWTDGTVLRVDAGVTTEIKLTANQGFHYLIGSPSVTTPTSGAYIYELIGASRPTISDGSLSPGTFTGLAGVEFKPGVASKIGLEGAVALGDATFAFSTTGGAYDPGKSTLTAGSSQGFSGWLRTEASADNPLGCSGNNCKIDVNGQLYGPQATSLGIRYSINGGSTSTTIDGVSVFRRGDPLSHN